MIEGDSATLAFYDAQAPIYAASGPGETSRHLAGFIARLPPAARVLELGCGDGRDAEAMLTAGLDVDLTDGSPALADQAAQRLARPVRIMRFGDLEAVDAYDAVWAAACLLHVPRDGLAEVLVRVRRALRPGGWHFASYKTGAREERDRFGRLFNRFSAEVLVGMYEAGGWEIADVDRYAGGGCDGKKGPWAGLTVWRPSTGIDSRTLERSAEAESG